MSVSTQRSGLACSELITGPTEESTEAFLSDMGKRGREVVGLFRKIMLRNCKNVLAQFRILITIITSVSYCL